MADLEDPKPSIFADGQDDRLELAGDALIELLQKLEAEAKKDPTKVFDVDSVAELLHITDDEVKELRDYIQSGLYAEWKDERLFSRVRFPYDEKGRILDPTTGQPTGLTDET